MSPPEERMVSWLTMERYALGELSEAERREVESRLRDSEANRSRLEQILADKSELPELPAPSTVVKLRGRKSRPWLGVGSLLAAAAMVALGVVSIRDGTGVGSRSSGVREHIKGGDVSVLLVSESGVRAPSKFGQGERFKVLVTCPPAFEETLRLLVFQGGQRYEPLAAPKLACGNSVPWPGAFTLDGDQRAEVCLAWGPRALGAPTRQELGDNVVCSELAPR